MERSLRERTARSKGKNDASFVPPLLPGDSLYAEIRNRSRGRSVWRLGAGPHLLGAIEIPRLTKVPCRSRSGLVAWCTPTFDQRFGGRTRLLSALESNRSYAFEMLSSHDMTSWRRINVAAYRDILGKTKGEVADLIETDAVTRDQQEGRQLLLSVNAWPG